MFRIMFEPKSGLFKIQFCFWGLIWLDVKMELEGGRETRRFDTYADARKWVEESGIAHGFDEQSTRNQPIANGAGSQYPYYTASPGQR